MQLNSVLILNKHNLKSMIIQLVKMEEASHKELIYSQTTVDKYLLFSWWLILMLIRQFFIKW